MFGNIVFIVIVRRKKAETALSRYPVNSLSEHGQTLLTYSHSTPSSHKEISVSYSTVGYQGGGHPTPP